MKRGILLVFVVLVLGACTTTKGLDTERTYRFDMANNGGVILFYGTLDYDKDQKSDQKSTASTTVSPDTTLAKADGGSEAQLVREGGSAMMDIAEKMFGNTLEETTQELTPAPVSTPVKVEEDFDPIVEEEPFVEEEIDDPPPSPSGLIEENDLKASEGRYHAWLFRGESDDISGPAMFVFNGDCGTHRVEDLAKSQGYRTNGMVYFAAPYEKEHGHGANSGAWTFGDVNGVFTPTGCKATNVKVYALED